MNITVIIPTYNRAHKILHVLQALDSQLCEGFSYSVLVMDDGSTDSTRDVLASYAPANHDFSWRSQPNSGAGIARNVLLKAVETELVVIIGDDITPAPDFLQSHRQAHLRHPYESHAILGRTVWDPKTLLTTVMSHIDGLGAQQFSYYYLKDGEYYDFRHFYTSNLSLKTSFIRSVDPIFRSDFHTYGFEDIELGLRLEKQGLKILYQRDALAYHDHFYSVRGFCRRQYNCGLSAKTFAHLHPEVRTLLGFGKLASFRHASLRPWVSRANRRFVAAITSIPQLEEKIFRLLSAYEYVAVDPLDRIYIDLFNYFYYKGLAEATLPDKTKNRTIVMLAREFLLPSLVHFLGHAHTTAIPLPEEDAVYFSQIAPANKGDGGDGRSHSMAVSHPN